VVRGRQREGEEGKLRKPARRKKKKGGKTMLKKKENRGSSLLSTRRKGGGGNRGRVGRSKVFQSMTNLNRSL